MKRGYCMLNVFAVTLLKIDFLNLTRHNKSRIWVSRTRKWEKMSMKSRKFKFSKMVGGKSGQVRNVPRGLTKRLRTHFLTFPQPFLTTLIFGFSSSFYHFSSIFRFRSGLCVLHHLHRHQHCRWRWYIARSVFWDVLSRPWGRCRLVLTFLQPFLKILIFDFSDSYFLIFEFCWLKSAIYCGV